MKRHGKPARHRNVSLIPSKERAPNARRRPADTKPAKAAWEAFAVAPPGLESITLGELTALGVKGARAVEGGVEFQADQTTIYRANLHLRTASRVLVRLASFKAISFAELEERARKVPWDRVLARGGAFQLRVTCRKSRLYHSGGVAQRLARDLAARLEALPAGRGDVEADEASNDAQLFVVRFDHDRCTISADSSGAHLHLRGYRTHVTDAPMRENLAAALVLASGWEPGAPIADPFCGSGTIPIEAAMIAANIAPGRDRDFRFRQWPGYDEVAWQRILERAKAGERTPEQSIVGADRSAAAIRAAEGNARRAGVEAFTEFVQMDAREIEPAGSEPGFIVSNPPYGVRLGDRDEVRQLSREFGQVLASRFTGWRVGLLTGGPGTVPGVALEERFRTTNGGLPVRFMVGEVRPGGATRRT